LETGAILDMGTSLDTGSILDTDTPLDTGTILNMGTSLAVLDTCVKYCIDSRTYFYASVLVDTGIPVDTCACG
jgi:hypothetical protein